MQACDELVERIKVELPIWGKEILDAGESVWKVNT
jgi:molybdopterin synthase catalytic subunit